MNLDHMTLREKVLQTFIVTIREINRHGGPERFFRDYPVGGMYFQELKRPLGENEAEMGTSTSLEQVERCRKAAPYPLLVCADSARAKGQEVFPSTRSLGGSLCLEDAYNYGRIAGVQMRENGIDWILQPNTDLYYNRSMPFLAATYDPVMNGEIYARVVEGIQEQGICATVKHFPGLGTTNINMHFAAGQNNLEFEEWMNTYGRGYQRTFAAGVCAVMTSHITLKSYAAEGERGFAPIATYSSALTTGLLKELLGFGGVVVTDALIMGGMAAGDLVAETVQAFRAGADMLLWPPVEAADRIVSLIEEGEIPMERLEDALTRISRMRQFRENAAVPVAADVAFINRVGEEIIRHGICCVRNEAGLLPLGPQYKKILLINASESEEDILLLRQEFSSRGFFAEIGRDIYDVESRVCWQDEIDRLQEPYDLVVFSVNTPLSASWSVPFMHIWASHLFQKSKKLIINYGSPYFAEDYFPEDPTLIQVNSAPSRAAVKAVVDGILGEMEFVGRPWRREEEERMEKSLRK